MDRKSAYARAGVDIIAGERAVELMKDSVSAASRPEVIGSIGGFAGLFDASGLAKYRRPTLATSTDGVGTKVYIASAMDIHDTIGYDLVGMLVDDLVVVGAEPLFLTDYIACGSVVPERIASIVRGISAACIEAGTALIGGETAEHPGLLDPDEYDVAGATTGVVEYDEILGSHLIQAGDRVLCLASSGLHSNGYSLVRQILLTEARLNLHGHIDELGCTLGEELLIPTRIYATHCLEVIRATEVHAMSHITGGGLANNLSRVIPSGLCARIDRSTWTPQPIFDLVQTLGKVSQPDIEQTLNMGVGMVMICPETSVSTTIDLLQAHGIHTWDGGEILIREEGEPQVELYGSHQ